MSDNYLSFKMVLKVLNGSVQENVHSWELSLINLFKTNGTNLATKFGCNKREGERVRGAFKFVEEKKQVEPIS